MMGNILDYYKNRVNGTGNPIVAQKFLNELEKTLIRIEKSAASYAFCEDGRLRKKGVRKAHLRHYKYKVLYHINGSDVIVDAICHDSQDYENMF